jgi:hypothetical protein
MDRYWRCCHCNNKRISKCPETGRGATSYTIRHLKNRHFIGLNADHQALPLQPTSFFRTVASVAASTATAAVTQTAGELISTLNMNRFRYLLILWIVMVQQFRHFEKRNLDHWSEILLYSFFISSETSSVVARSLQPTTSIFSSM